MLPLSYKTLIACFLVGSIFGLTVSPFINTRPKQAFITPINQVFAQSTNIGNDNKVNNNNTIQKMFAYFDRQQQLWQQNEKAQILGIKTENQIISSASGQLTIAIIGDSMVDTMETNLPYLEKALKSVYPNYQFNLLNYGIGGENITKGLSRIDQELNYKDRKYPAITQTNADIIIIESFAYNPDGDNPQSLDIYQQSLKTLIYSLKPKKALIFMATICPLKVDFGKGPNGVNWPSDLAYQHATKIQSYLETSLNLAQEMNIPIIDAYHPTLQTNGEGIKNYVNPSDGIHPSVSGHQYLAQLMVNKIISLEIIN